MSLAGFKKQINKANQFMSEKIGGAKGTELDEDFMELERKTDIMTKLVDELMLRSQEYLQPNPASRAKLSASRGISKLRGQATNALYPQPEGLLGECMLKYGRELGDESIFGQSLVECGEAYKRLAEEKYTLEDGVKQNFLDPFNQLQNKDIKEVNFHRKKLSGRRLDYDCKKRKKDKGGTVPEEEIRQAEEKFVESKELAESAMHNLLTNDVEQVTALLAFIEGEVDYHRHCVDHLQSLVETLKIKRDEAARRPRQEHIPRRAAYSSESFSSNRSSSPTPSYEKGNDWKKYDSADGGRYNDDDIRQDPFSMGEKNNYNNNEPTYSVVNKPSQQKSMYGQQQACAEALYDFDPENPGELEFKEGDRITLLARVDDNWYEGSIRGRTGLFPVNYVKVIVPLPR